jgi:uncharacterized membrane protein YdjX (TVP38/TMEM64 family)
LERDLGRYDCVFLCDVAQFTANEARLLDSYLKNGGNLVFFLGEGVLERFGKAGELVAKQVKHSGFVSMLIARLIPGPPFAVWNYAAGIARMNFIEYFFATLLGTLPAHIVFAYCADALFNGTMTHGEAMKRFSIVAVLLISMIVLTTILKRHFARNGVNG